MDFGKNKSGHDTVTITDLLPVHGPNIGTAKTTYVIGYSAPDWLTPAISQVKNKLKRLAEEDAKKAAKAKAAEEAKREADSEPSSEEAKPEEAAAPELTIVPEAGPETPELTVVPETKAPAKPKKTKKAPPKAKKEAA